MTMTSHGEGSRKNSCNCSFSSGRSSSKCSHVSERETSAAAVTTTTTTVARPLALTLPLTDSGMIFNVMALTYVTLGCTIVVVVSVMQRRALLAQLTQAKP